MGPIATLILLSSCAPKPVERETNAGGRGEPTPASTLVATTGAAPAPEPSREALPDADGDGIEDASDACPDRAGVAAHDGCPPPVTIAPLTASDLFVVGTDELAPSANPLLDPIVNTLNDDPHLRVEVQGHTDGRGSQATNQTLSERRAVAVQGYLIERGIEAQRVTAKGYGPDRPMADNTTAEGRAKNRRIEFHVTSH